VSHGSLPSKLHVHLSSSHWRGYEAWAACHHGHVILSQWRDPLHSWLATCQTTIGEFLRSLQDK